MKLAIKGHATRGKEVIEILEMLGGENEYELRGTNEECVYFEKNGVICNTSPFSVDFRNIKLFTLEEFLEKYPYKVGDKVHIPEYESEVRICKMRWYGFGDIEYLVYRNDDGEWYTAEDLKEYNADFLMDKENGEISINITLTHSNKEGEKKSLLSSLIEYFKTTPKDVLEREWNEHKELDEIGPTVEEYIDFVERFKKNSKYPKTYEECCKIEGGIAPSRHLQYDTTPFYQFEEDLRDSLENLRKLIICRDAYWKIAGEEMGLGKPWEPDLGNEELYCMYNYWGQIIKSSTTLAFNKILIFPTEEMRDVFYENFMDLIEKCKELL